MLQTFRQTSIAALRRRSRLAAHRLDLLTVWSRVAHSLVLGDIISSIVLFWHGDDDDENDVDNDNDNAGEPGELSQMDAQIPAGDAEEPELKQVFSCTRH